MKKRSRNVADQLEKEATDDHELILSLKDKLEALTDELHTTERHLEDSLTHHNETATQLAVHEKLNAQHKLLRSIFAGVILLVVCMWSLVFVGWVTNQTSIEREMAFFERIILVFIGIVGGDVSSFLDVRNFTVSNGNVNGNGNNTRGKKPDDTE